MKMTSMMLPKQKMDDKQEMGAGMPMDMSEEKYPYGLCISLDEEQIKALGMTDLPKAGAGMTVLAKCTVKCVRSEEVKDGMERHVELQITDMGIEDANASIADRMYGKNK
jgi:Major coat protein-like